MGGRVDASQLSPEAPEQPGHVGARASGRGVVGSARMPASWLMNDALVELEGHVEICGDSLPNPDRINFAARSLISSGALARF